MDAPHKSRSFPETQWSLIALAAGDGGDTHRQREALSLLLHRYLPALRAHLTVGRRISGDLADDLLQGFLADKVIEQNLLEHARREKGRFRVFLRVTLDRYLISQHRARSAGTRAPGGGAVVVSLGDDGHGGLVAGATEHPADSYCLAWARELLAEAVERMRCECERSGRADVWRVFESRVLGPAFDAQPPVAYDQLVRELNLTSPLDACNLLTTAKRMFSRSLRASAAEYAAPEGGIDEELEDLRRIISGTGGAESGRSLRS